MKKIKFPKDAKVELDRCGISFVERARIHGIKRKTKHIGGLPCLLPA